MFIKLHKWFPLLSVYQCGLYSNKKFRIPSRNETTARNFWESQKPYNKFPRK
jgi:hypothetical protein